MVGGLYEGTGGGKGRRTGGENYILGVDSDTLCYMLISCRLDNVMPTRMDIVHVLTH